MLFVPVRTGLPWLTESINLLRHQLVGLLRGASGISQGRLVRPAGVRIVDVLMQEYEGSLTLFPNWHLSDIGGFIANFDAARMENYELDGARAVWPKLPAIRSLCEIEFELDRISKQLTEQLAVERTAAAMAMGGGFGGFGGVGAGGGGTEGGGRLFAPRSRGAIDRAGVGVSLSASGSYSSGLAGLDPSAEIEAEAIDRLKPSTSVRQTHGQADRPLQTEGSCGDFIWEAARDDELASGGGVRMPQASSHASLLSLGAV